MDRMFESDWKRLAKKTATFPLFAGIPVCRESGLGTRIESSPAARCAGGLFIAVLGIVTVGACLAVDALGAAWKAGFLVMGLMFIAAGLRYLLLANRLCFDPAANIWSIRYGCRPFARQLEFPGGLAKMIIRPERNGGELSQYRKGRVAIVFAAPGSDGSLPLVHLAVANRRESLNLLIERLSAVCAVEDQTLAEVTLAGGRALRLYVTGVCSGNMQFRTMRSFRRGEQYTFVPTFLWKAVFGFVLLFGMAGLAVLLRYDLMPWNLYFAVGLLLMFGFGMFLFYTRKAAIKTVFDRNSQKVIIKQGLPWLDRTVEYPFSSIGGLQACVQYETAETDFIVYELNLVLNQIPLAGRVTIQSDINPKRLLAEIAKLADFLEKPVFDHT